MAPAGSTRKPTQNALTSGRRNLQMGVEDATHLRSMVIFTVQVIVPLLHAELPLAGTDGRGACAVTGKGRRHREGLHPGFSPESSFTYAKRDDVVTKEEKRPPQCPASLPTPCKTTPSGKFWQQDGLPAILRTRPEREVSCQAHDILHQRGFLHNNSLPSPSFIEI